MNIIMTLYYITWSSVYLALSSYQKKIRDAFSEKHYDIEKVINFEF